MNHQNGSKLNQSMTVGAPAVSDTPTNAIPTQANGRSKTPSRFDQPVILRQSSRWSHAILWGLIGVTTFGVIWASVAKIEQAVPAQGKLEPKGVVKEMKVPVSGVVTDINVEEGERVEEGDLLLSLEPSATEAELTSLSKVRAALVRENQFYRSQLRNTSGEAIETQALSELDIPPEMASLTESRRALIEENQLYRALRDGNSPETANLTPAQRTRWSNARREVSSRVGAAESEVAQLERQLQQNELQLANARESLAVQQQILGKLELLREEGAFAEIPVIERRQAVNDRQAEVDVRLQEKVRLEAEIDKARQQLENTKALTDKELDDRIAANEIKIAEIDSQLNKIVVENDKRIAELDSQLKQAELTLSYQEVRAPVSGKVFDLQPTARGFVANTAEPVLKIVPGDNLVARVFLTNKDIGFVEEGMQVDVRIDSFPFSEFGDIKGELVSIGSDALPPTEVRPYYSFPAEIRLDKQSLEVNGREVPLQSGMSVSTNILVRKRTVLSIFTDLFTEKTESLKKVR